MTADDARLREAMTPGTPVEAVDPATRSRRLGRNASIYVASNLIVSGMSALLTLLYARAMRPEDLAVVAVSNSIGAVLGIVLGLSLEACIPRLFFEYDEDDRRRFFGTLLAISFVFPTAFVAGLFALGSFGYLDVFENVRFDPHLKLVLLTSLTAVYRPLAVTAYRTREEPSRVAALSLLAAAAQIAFAFVFVVVLSEGAVGALQANLAAGVLTAIVSIWLMARLSAFDARLPRSAAALAFSLPLVPHLAANWGLAVSDRIILDRYVPAGDLGRYSLAFLFGQVVGLVGSSVVSALTPIANQHLKDERLRHGVPRLGTYTIFVVAVFALGTTLLAPELILVLAPAYGSASQLVPWMVAGAVLQSLYFVLATGTWFSMRTGAVPFVTGAAAVTNIGLNLVLVPYFGVMAAAFATVVAYALLAALHAVLAARLYPIRWEYRRWAPILGLAVVWAGIGMVLAPGNVSASVALKVLITIVLFPASLLLTRALAPADLRDMAGIAAVAT